MHILAFETSCDDTSVALMRDDVLLTMSTRTQLEHDATGGVVPEVAARSHANAIFPCIEDVLRETSLTLQDIDLIASTRQPGLMPSLLTGIVVAETLALSLARPILWIDHIEGHIFANLLGRSLDDVKFPAIVLTVSGGHTEIYLWRSLYELEILGQTHDDAAGECFDKVSKMMGMGFPGGKKIADLALSYERSPDFVATAERIFPTVLLDRDSLDFSFSGLKSAVKRYIDDVKLTPEGLTDIKKAYIAYEFEEVVTDILTTKLIRAHEKTGAEMMVLAGGVSANTKLKNKLQKQADIRGIRFIAPQKILYSMDNAAMIGIRAFYEYKKQSL